MNRRRGRRRLLVAGLIVVVACVVAAAANAGRVLVVSTELPEPDAILVLASHEWERIPEAAIVAQRVPTSHVLLTVPRLISEHNCHRCSERGDWLVRLGVDASRLTVIPRGVTNTRAEALAAFAFCSQNRIQRLLVVTSPYHTRRAKATFEHVFAGSGIEIGIRPASAHSVARPAQWWRASYDRLYAFYEWSALALYLMRYGIITWQ